MKELSYQKDLIIGKKGENNKKWAKKAQEFEVHNSFW